MVTPATRRVQGISFKLAWSGFGVVSEVGVAREGSRLVEGVGEGTPQWTRLT